jgi:N-acetylneuraminic acid mutarotase
VQVFISLDEGIYLIGGNGNAHNNLHYNNTTIKIKKNLPQEKTFFSAVYLKGKIYTFGGYDAYSKLQLKSCEYYDTKLDRWYNSKLTSPSGTCEFELNSEKS